MTDKSVGGRVQIDWTVNATTLMALAASAIGLYLTINDKLNALSTNDVKIELAIAAARQETLVKYESNAARIQRLEKSLDDGRQDRDLLLQINTRLQRIENQVLMPTERRN